MTTRNGSRVPVARLDTAKVAKSSNENGNLHLTKLAASPVILDVDCSTCGAANGVALWDKAYLPT